jgi:hypothetical protein
MTRNIILIAIFLFFLAFLAYVLIILTASIKPDINSVSFECITDDDCELVQIECCNNNAPTQNTCIDKDHAPDWNAGLQSYCAKLNEICPMYFAQGSYKCFCKENICWTNFTSYNEFETYTGVLGGSK